LTRRLVCRVLVLRTSMQLSRLESGERIDTSPMSATFALDRRAHDFISAWLVGAYALDPADGRGAMAITRRLVDAEIHRHAPRSATSSPPKSAGSGRLRR